MAEGREQKGIFGLFRGKSEKTQPPRETELDRQEREIKRQLAAVLAKCPLLDEQGQPIRTVNNGSTEAQLYTAPQLFYSPDQHGGDGYLDTEGILELQLEENGTPMRLSYHRANFDLSKTGGGVQVKEELDLYASTKNASKMGGSLAQSEVVPRWKSWIPALTQLAQSQSK